MATPRKRLRPDEVKSIRAALGMTQREFARVLAVARPTLARWETGHQRMAPSHANLIRLVARVRGVRQGRRPEAAPADQVTA